MDWERLEKIGWVIGGVGSGNVIAGILLAPNHSAWIATAGAGMYAFSWMAGRVTNETTKSYLITVIGILAITVLSTWVLRNTVVERLLEIGYERDVLAEPSNNRQIIATEVTIPGEVGTRWLIEFRARKKATEGAVAIVQFDDDFTLKRHWFDEPGLIIVRKHGERRRPRVFNAADCGTCGGGRFDDHALSPVQSYYVYVESVLEIAPISCFFGDALDENESAWLCGNGRVKLSVRHAVPR